MLSVFTSDALTSVNFPDIEWVSGIYFSLDDVSFSRFSPGSSDLSSLYAVVMILGGGVQLKLVDLPFKLVCHLKHWLQFDAIIIEWYFSQKFPWLHPSSNGNIFHISRRALMLMFSLICTSIIVWVNNLEADDLRQHRAHCDVIVMHVVHPITNQWGSICGVFCEFRGCSVWFVSCNLAFGCNACFKEYHVILDPMIMRLISLRPLWKNIIYSVIFPCTKSNWEVFAISGHELPSVIIRKSKLPGNFLKILLVSVWTHNDTPKQTHIVVVRTKKWNIALGKDL